MRRVSRNLEIGIALLACLTGCTRSLRWSEDVRLPDGRVITLQRYQEFGGAHELLQEPTESDYWLEFKPPDSGKTVRWSSDRTLATVALMMDGTVPRLLLTPQFDGVYTHKCPDPPYLLYEFRNGRWASVPLAVLRGMRVVPNMTYSPSDARAEIESSGKHVSMPEVGLYSAGRMNDITIDFGKLATQTFGVRCSPPLHTLEEKREHGT